MSIPKGRHGDWLWPFSYIPRRWTAFNSTRKPHVIIGSKSLRDAQRNGGWTYLDITPV